MTEPTDAEAWEMWLAQPLTGHAPKSVGNFARAVLAKFGTPPAVAGEPVAWMGAYDKTELYYRKPPQGDVVPLYRTPQPTQAQAGAVPLTEQQINEMWYDQWDGFVSFAEAEVIVRATEEAHGIKGGQHGAE